MEFNQLVQFFVDNDQFSKSNGATLIINSPGNISYRMIVKDIHQSSPGACHGGVIAGFMDSILGAAALTKAFLDQKLVSTVEFKINYVRPVAIGETLCGEGRIEHSATRLLTSSGKITIENSGELVALGLGTFNLYPIEKKQHLRPT